jgi:nucleoside-diphosphate-sugar epimerase
MRPNSVFSLFIQRALHGEPISIQGSGQQGRQFTHARDIGRAFAAALKATGSGTVFNTVADENVTIAELAALVSRRIPTRIENAPARQADVPSALVSNKLIEAELGWRPEVRFSDGLDELIAAQREAGARA